MSPSSTTPPLSEANILITGGTGSFGQRLLLTLLNQYQPRRAVIFSRDELKQYELQQKLLDHPQAESVRFFLGDVRDRDRLVRAFDGVDDVVHAAALKQVPAAEYEYMPRSQAAPHAITRRSLTRAAGMAASHACPT